MAEIIPFDKRDGWIWQDGKFVPWQEAKCHILTHGLHYASSVFEGVRVYDGQIFKLREHTQRLFDSAKTLDMKVPFTIEEIEQAQIESLEKNNIKNGYLRPVIWRGSEQMSVVATNSKIHVAVASWVWPSYFDPEVREKGLRLKTSRWARPAPNTAPVSAKAAGLYMICTLSKHEVLAAGFDDALMLDYRGYVAESTAANIFFVKDGEIHTPLPDCFLNGITRQTVIGLAKKRGLNVTERHIKPEEYAQMQECFVTGTAAEVTPVQSIDEAKFQLPQITKLLMDDYTALVKA